MGFVFGSKSGPESVPKTKSDRDPLQEPFPGLQGKPGGVGSDDEVAGGKVGSEEGVICGRRLHREDIQSRAGQALLSQGVGEGFVIDEGAATDVEKVCAGLHESEGFGINEVHVVVRERAVQGDDIRSSEELVA